MADPVRQSRERVIAGYVDLFNNPPGTVEQLRDLVAEDACFEDPFNVLTGLDSIYRMLADFARRVRSPSFEVRYCAWDGDVCLLRWDLRATVPLIGEWVVPGVSEIHFDPSDRICLHVDHWDAASHFYQRLPVIGTLLRLLRRRVAAA